MFGDRIEDYEILEHLGKGGFAHVYRARCRKSGIFLAIKMIDKALMASAGMIGRVRQEVTIHSRLKHPAILELYTFFEDLHYVYLVLELAHNGELAKHFKLGTRGLSEKAASDIFRQVVSGVLYLHTHNIIHRDLSLNNLLLTKDLTVKIADFGLATQLNGPDEKHVTMCGTPNYISPEVASRELHGLPADVWGLGCMLYTLLVGRPPFHTQHVKTTLNKVINADYKIPTDLSIQAQDLLQKLLCKDPIKRITLKAIMEHPFVNNSFNIISKQELSRDSGFITTMHSTQHSSKIRCEDNIHNSETDYQNRIYASIEQKYNPETNKSTSLNLFNHMKQENAISAQCDGFNNMCANNYDSGKNEGLQMKSFPQNVMLPKYENACGTSILENINNLNVKCSDRGNTPNINMFNENKENVNVKMCNSKSNSNTLGVPPLCADRLPTISHNTRNAILKIESTGVIVEFIKKKNKDKEAKVVEICKISKDGMKIIIYTIDSKDKTKMIDHNPSPDEVFTYHNLPQKHWKKYLYAARFVELVKAKTPKITLYTLLAKCQLMENCTDIEMFFYSGEKITKSSTEGITIIDKNLKIHHNFDSPELKYLLNHFDECANRLNRVQSALSCIPDECFPLIIGRRPIQPAQPRQCSVNLNYNSPAFNIGSFNRTTSSTQAGSDYNVL